MTQFYTYLHCKPDGTPFYVGKGNGKRGFSFKQRNAHHRNIVRKYGADNIGVFIFPCESEKEAFSDEIHQIAQLRQDGCPLVNQTDGGEGPKGAVRSAETRKKIGLINGFRGKKHTEETKRVMAEKATGRTKSDATKKIISDKAKGRKHTESAKAKVTASLLGNKRGVGSKSKSGQTLSDETKRKIGLSKLGVKRKPFSEEYKRNMSVAATARWDRHRCEKGVQGG